jgi:hypothetical protein
MCLSLVSVIQAEATGPLRLMLADSGSMLQNVMIQFRENLCSPHYRCYAHSMQPLLPAEWGGIIKYNSTNYGSVEKLDGSWNSAPKEEQHEVKIGGLLWWCLKIIIGMETNFRVRKKFSQAQTVFIMQHSSLLTGSINWSSLRENHSRNVSLLDWVSGWGQQAVRGSSETSSVWSNSPSFPEAARMLHNLFCYRFSSKQINSKNIRPFSVYYILPRRCYL